MAAVGLCVNAVSPGYTDTKEWDKARLTMGRGDIEAGRHAPRECSALGQVYVRARANRLISARAAPTDGSSTSACCRARQ